MSSWFEAAANAFLGLPQSEIDELSLTLLPKGKRRFGTEDGVVKRETYIGNGNFGFHSTVIATSIPALGFGLLETMRFRINLVEPDVDPNVPEGGSHG